jgi:hypothetical protein
MGERCISRPSRCNHKEEDPLKKVVTLAVAAMALLGVTGLALAQYPLPVVTYTGEVTPTKAGTKKKPKRSTLRLNFKVNKESRVTTDQMTFFTPQHVVLSGVGFRYCPATQVNANGVATCPAGSEIGKGTASALVGPRQTPLIFNVRVFWGSRNQMTFYLEQQGGSIKVALAGPITRAGAPYGQQITINIPQGLQSPAPGTYATIESVDATIAGGTGKTRKTVKVRGKKRKRTFKTYSVVTVGCPADRTHDHMVRLRLVPNPSAPPQQSVEGKDTSACTR